MNVVGWGVARRAGSRWIERALAIAGLLLLWQLLAVTVLASTRVVPTPGEVLGQLWLDRASYLPNVTTTLREALLGYFWGNLVAIALGLTFELVPVVEGPLLRLAIACFNIPQVAIAPILVVVLTGNGPKVALAALAVFFTTLIATMLGLRSADATSRPDPRLWRRHRDGAAQGQALGGPTQRLRRAAGGRPGRATRRLDRRIPRRPTGVGRSDDPGPVVVYRRPNLRDRPRRRRPGRFALPGGFALARLLTPWAAHVDLGLGVAPSRRASGLWRRLARAIGLVALSAGVLIVAWFALVRGFGLDRFFAKDPVAVYRFLVVAPNAPAHRQALLAALGQTLTDAAVGYLVGTLAATATAILVVLSRRVEQTVMPVAITLRSVPLVAMTPLIALTFGRGFLGVTAVVAIVTFFPTLVNVAVGLRSAPTLACDVVRAAGGGAWLEVRKVRLPHALPAFFASARIAAPAAIGGATLAELLATGKGLGSLLIVSYSASDFSVPSGPAPR